MIRNLTMRGGRWGIISNRSGTFFSGIYITNNYSSFVFGFVVPLTDVLIEHVTITLTKSSALVLACPIDNTCTRIIIRNSIFRDIDSVCVALGAEITNQPVSNIQFLNNVLRNCTPDALRISGGSAGVLVADNVFAEYSSDGVSITSPSTLSGVGPNRYVCVFI